MKTKTKTKTHPLEVIIFLILITCVFLAASDMQMQAQAQAQIQAQTSQTIQKYTYETEVALYGTLVRYPGETPDGKKITYPAILLKNPIIVEGGLNPGDFDETETGVILLQLSLDQSTWDVFNMMEGDYVQITGTLYHSHNAHHHTNVLISVSSINLIKM